jgi:phenylalanyl-tRNA synthetase beta chain
MPQSTLSTSLIFRQLKKELSKEEVERTLFRTKAELVEMKDDDLTIEITHDRLDMLCESGLALALEGILGLARGMPGESGRSGAREGLAARADGSVSRLRGEISMAVATAPAGTTLDLSALSELVKFQELLHATLGRDRRTASIGLYPLRHLRSPFLYAMEPLKNIRFTPLPDETGNSSEMDGREFFEKHPMAEKYGALGKEGDLALTLRDSVGNILSLPPVLNSAKHGEISTSDSEVLVESTGTTAVTCREMVAYMTLPFVARGWTITPVPVAFAKGVDHGRATVEARDILLEQGPVSKLLGVPLTEETVKSALLASRLGVKETKAGLQVSVPPWRPDILGSVDLIEEVAMAMGLDRFPPEFETPSTQGRRMPFTRFCGRFLEVMVGMGYQEMHTPCLIAQGLSDMLTTAGVSIPLKNPVSQEFACLRPTLLPGLVGALAHNTGEKYPQRLFELSEVVVRDSSSDSGTRTDTHLSFVDAGEDSGFARSAAVAERLARVIGVLAVRDSGEAPGAISGRVAYLKLAGETIAVLGEVHPRVLAELKIQQPASWAEFNLSVLWKLKGK